MRTAIHINGPRIYEYKGWQFEFSYTGPWPLRKDGELRARAGRQFWKVFYEWDKLPDKDRYRIGGGSYWLHEQAAEQQEKEDGK